MRKMKITSILKDMALSVTIALGFLALILLGSNAFAEIVDATFDPPTEREDGTVLTPAEIQGYMVLDKGAVIDPALLVFGDGTVAIDLPYGRHDLTMKTIDTDGLVSANSPMFSFVLNANPKSPMIKGVSRR